MQKRYWKQRVLNTSNGRTMTFSKHATYGSKKSRFIKDEESKGPLSNLGVRTPVSIVPILGDILLWNANSFEVHVKSYKNEWKS